MNRAHLFISLSFYFPLFHSGFILFSLKPLLDLSFCITRALAYNGMLIIIAATFPFPSSFRRLELRFLFFFSVEMGVMEIFWCFSLLGFCLLAVSSAQMPGFVSIDCGGTTNYTDNLGLNWIPDNYQIYGNTTTLSNQNQNSKQYTTVRYFPGDNLKYCYTLPVKTRTRYLIRATFLYGNFDNSNVYPSFDISFGATHWSTIEISDANSVEVEELVFLASSPKINVCLSNATTGQPFISTLELRQFNGSLYHTTTEAQFFMSLSARINFGAETTDPVRYPDDPFDRIWESDSVRKPNFLVDVAPGTEKISTITPIDMDSSTEMPPQKVMQTAVVGRNGTLTYRLDLVGFPGNGWAFSYFAEIEDIATDDSRKFRLYIPGIPDISKPIVNVQENAHGKYRVYEPGYYNLSLPFVFSFEFKQTSDSLLGPILNALEIYHYLPINYGSIDASAIASFTSHYASADWANEGGDPCLPASWSWVQCSSDPQPKITSIILSGKNITGAIPSELTKLTGLVTLRLDNNSLSGPIPDFSGCINLQYIHLENNELTGTLPASLADLPNLKELYVQNNTLTGTVPQGLIAKNIILNYSGNMGLHKKNISMSQKTIIILCSCIGVGIILFAVICCLFACKKRESPNRSHKENVASAPHAQKMSAFFSEVATETAHRFSLAEIEEATTKFEKRIGSGGFGIVYYGKLKDGKEIAVKVLTNDSFQGIREFLNEVSLLSKIHHRNLVAFLGYSQQDGKNILVYEFMHNGTLKEHLRGASAKARTLTWIKRLRIAEDSAKGIEYLHTGCSPTIIHRDLKSSNILLDSHMRAKVADFGLSKPQVDGSHVSSIVRGTVGYLDPEYYISQQLTEKSDIYSFGVILLELITGHEPISNENFGANCRNIIAWAKSHIDSGNIQAIIDPLLDEDYDMQSIWKIAEVAITCVKPHGVDRPSISDILKEIQEAIAIERDSIASAELPEKSKNSMGSSSANMDAAGLATPDRNDAFNSVFGVQPVLR